MKIRYVTIGLAVLLLCVLPPAKIHANQPSDFLIRNYTIGLVVDCLDTALEQLSNMPGIILNSHIDIQSGWGNMDRRVANRDLERALADLRSFGQIVTNNSSSQNVFAVVSDLRSEFQVRNTEYDRLMQLLYEVDTLNQFTSVENRLVQVIADMEHIRGRLNHLELETGTSRINISLFVVEEEIYIEEPGAFERINLAFTSSNQVTLSVLQGILIFLAYISVPLVSYGLFAGVIIWLVVLRKKKKSVVNNESAENKSAEIKNVEIIGEIEGTGEIKKGGEVRKVEMQTKVLEGVEEIGDVKEEAEIGEAETGETEIGETEVGEDKNDE